jgi:putative oxidoreductase
MIQNLTALWHLNERLQRLWTPWAQDALSIVLRLMLADVFLRSGWLKLQSWDSTLMLFEHEYAVPVLPHELAAWLGTGGELVLPALLMIGLFGRFSAAGLFVLNAVAAISYPDISDAGLKDHVLWGWWCVVLICTGPGRLSIDHWLNRKIHA